MTKEDLKPLSGEQVVSINDRKRLDKIKQTYPKLEIIVGEVTEGDEAVKLNLNEMDDARNKIFDAATISVFGNRVDKLEKDRKLPATGILMLISFLAGVGTCFLAYNL